MTNPLDRLADGFPHGTLEGEAAGCTTADCPAKPMSCRDVALRHRQDRTFRRLYDTGLRGEDLVDALAIASGMDPEKVNPRFARTKLAEQAPVPAERPAGYRVVPMEMWALLDGDGQIVLVAREESVASGYLERLNAGETL